MAETLDAAAAAAAGETPPPSVALPSRNEFEGLAQARATVECFLEAEEMAPDAPSVEGGDRGRFPQVLIEATPPDEVTARECDGIRACSALKEERRGKQNDATIDLASFEVYSATLTSKSQLSSPSQSRSMVNILDLETEATAEVGETSANVVSPICSSECGELAQNFELGGPFIETEVRVFDAAGEMKDEVGKLPISRYTRKELELMRSCDVVEQKQRWKEVYEGLREVTAQEYDGLGVDSASASKKQKRGRKKKVAKVLPVVSEEVGADSESSDPLGCSGIVCDDANVGTQSNQVEESYNANVGTQSNQVEESYNANVGTQSNQVEESYNANVGTQSNQVEESYNANVGNQSNQVEESYNANVGTQSNEVEESYNDNVGTQSNQAEEWCCEFEGTNNEDDSSNDESDSIQRRAFIVVGEPDFDSGPPQDGMEYLRRVRWEAAQIPNVKVAKLKSTKQASDQTPYMPKIPEIEKCSSHLLPSKHWEDSFIAEFSELRQAFSQLGDSCNQLTAMSQNENYWKNPNHTQKPKTAPTVSLLCSMDAVYRAMALRKYIRMIESENELSGDDYLWLFALTVAVETPLDADLCASMRCLLRKCSSLLARKSDPDDEVAMLNILIAISGIYFGQSEK